MTAVHFPGPRAERGVLVEAEEFRRIGPRHLFFSGDNSVMRSTYHTVYPLPIVGWQVIHFLEYLADTIHP